MRRGFLTSRPSAASTSASPAANAPATVEKKPAKPAQRVDLSLAALKVSDDYAVPVADDHSDVLQQEPVLIFRSDKRMKGSPFHGYFPPGKQPPALVYFDMDVEVLRAAARWPAWKQTVPTVAKAERCYEVKRRKRDGKVALLASRKIAKGELIVRERPYLIISIKCLDLTYDTVHWPMNALARLGLKQRKMAMSHRDETLPEFTFGNLVKTSLPISVGPNEYGLGDNVGVFETIPKAGASCCPNAHYFFEFDVDLTGRLYAVRDIEAGEEISFCRAELLEPRQQRTAYMTQLRKQPRGCPICSLPEDQRKLSDAKRAFISDVREKLIDSLVVDEAEIKKAIRLTEEEGIPYEALLLKQLGARTISWRNPAVVPMQAVQWMKEAREGYRQMEGPDSMRSKMMNEFFNDVARAFGAGPDLDGLNEKHPETFIP